MLDCYHEHYYTFDCTHYKDQNKGRDQSQNQPINPPITWLKVIVSALDSDYPCDQDKLINKSSTHDRPRLSDKPIVVNK